MHIAFVVFFLIGLILFFTKHLNDLPELLVDENPPEIVIHYSNGLKWIEYTGGTWTVINDYGRSVRIMQYGYTVVCGNGVEHKFQSSAIANDFVLNELKPTTVEIMGDICK